MKLAAIAIVVSLALSPALAAEQGRGNEKPKEAPAGQPAQKPATPQGKAKGKQPGTKAPGSSTDVVPASCSPDQTAPVIQSVSATPNVLTTPNHRMTPITISARVTDNCSTPTWSVSAVSSDEPIDGTGDGDTAPDWTIASAHAVSLRAERAGRGDGRVYTITITARDAAGNTSAATATVSVPHNR